jgi:hypothetical protein
MKDFTMPREGAAGSPRFSARARSSRCSAAQTPSHRCDAAWTATTRFVVYGVTLLALHKGEGHAVEPNMVHQHDMAVPQPQAVVT